MSSELNNLTFQEQDILELLIFGNSVNSIAKELFLDKSYIHGVLLDLDTLGLVSKTMDAGYVFKYRGTISEFFLARQQSLLEDVNLRMKRSHAKIH